MFWHRFVLLFLLPCTYALFGWYVSQETSALSRLVLERGEEMDMTLLLRRLDLGLYGLALFFVVSIATILTLLSERLANLLTGSLKTDIGTFTSILIWSLTAVFFLHWLENSLRLLILIAAATLGRLELQEAGYNRWQIFFALTFLCLGSLVAGILAYQIWGEALRAKIENVP